MDVIRRKTAVLFQGACRIGASLADAGDDEKAVLSDYGFKLGIAFQMADDLLDYTQLDAGTLGKNAGADLREGKLTLPAIYTLKTATLKDRNQIESVIKNKDFSVGEFQTLIGLLKKYGGLEYAREKALTYVDEAKAALLFFPSSKTRDILLGFAEYALARNA